LTAKITKTLADQLSLCSVSWTEKVSLCQLYVQSPASASVLYTVVGHITWLGVPSYWYCWTR